MTEQRVTTQNKKPALNAGGSVNAIVPQDLDQAFRLGNAICAANMAPKAYERSAEKITIGILHGLEVGLTPMAALQSIAVINGTPSIWGDGALALVRSSGLLEDFEETIEGDGDTRKATCRAKRRDQKTPITKTFSMAEAATAGLKGKSGPWKQYPDRMLQMRARSYALRDGFADVLKGLRFTEEVRDMNPKDMGTIEGDAPPRPKQTDFDPEKPEAAETFLLVDEFGNDVGRYVKSEFVDEAVDRMEVFKDRKSLDDFMENNADVFESLGARSNERKDIAETFNTACGNFDAPEETVEEFDWQAWHAEFEGLIYKTEDESGLNALLGFKQSDTDKFSKLHPKWHAELLKSINERQAALSSTDEKEPGN